MLITFTSYFDLSLPITDCLFWFAFAWWPAQLFFCLPHSLWTLYSAFIRLFLAFLSKTSENMFMHPYVETQCNAVHVLNINCTLVPTANRTKLNWDQILSQNEGCTASFVRLDMTIITLYTHTLWHRCLPYEKVDGSSIMRKIQLWEPRNISKRVPYNKCSYCYECFRSQESRT